MNSGCVASSCLPGTPSLPMLNYSYATFSRNAKFVGEMHKKQGGCVAEGGSCLTVFLAGVAECKQ